MRLQVSEILTLDGVMETPEQWMFPYMDQEIGEDVIAALQKTDALLFGRKAFQVMAAARLQLVNTKAYKTGMLTLNYESAKQQ